MDTGRSALVTGGAGGLGAAIARALAAVDYRVGVLDLKNTANDVVQTIADAVALSADVTSEDEMRAAIAAFGATPDVLVNAAGIVVRGPMLERTLADFRRVLEVNLMGAVTSTYIIAPGMMARGRGVIINIASIVGAVSGGPNVGGYAASKAGMVAYTEQMALELRPFVRVNAVAPGMIDSGIGAASTYADAESLRSRVAAQPAGRLGTADDVAAAVIFLASEAASFVNGHTLVVDGGLSSSVLAQLSVNRR
jgi:NAD(P)-dependent dehydrogenase (short-subunit alcohol dehydrogenase family)